MTLEKLKLLKELLDEFDEEYRDYDDIGIRFLLDTEIAKQIINNQREYECTFFQ